MNPNIEIAQTTGCEPTVWITVVGHDLSENWSGIQGWVVAFGVVIGNIHAVYNAPHMGVRVDNQKSDAITRAAEASLRLIF